MKTELRLEKLATIAEVDPKGLKHALIHSFPDWVPNADGPTIPNSEYTATRDPLWRAVSVMVAKIITGKDVSAESIRSLVMQFAAKADDPPTSEVATAVNIAPTEAPNFKNDPPFGKRVPEQTRALCRAFIAEFDPAMNIDKWCGEYAEKVRPGDGWDCRPTLYKYVQVPSRKP